MLVLKRIAKDAFHRKEAYESDDIDAPAKSADPIAFAHLRVSSAFAGSAIACLVAVHVSLPSPFLGGDV